LKDVLIALKKNSFQHSPFPVTLSIEMHCSLHQQKIMAKYFKTILVDIYVIDEDNPPNDFPTLNELKNKFIIKVILYYLQIFIGFKTKNNKGPKRRREY